MRARKDDYLENIFWEVCRAREAFATTFINKIFALVAPFIARTDTDAQKLSLSWMFLQRHLNRVDDGDAQKPIFQARTRQQSDDAIGEDMKSWDTIY
ncbi:MAG: hypothetical protein VW057_08800 [Rhodospirillaceae bacterium]